MSATEATEAAPANTFARLLHDRGALLTGITLLAVVALAWIAVVVHTVAMAGMRTPMVPAPPGSLTDAAVFTMTWGVMMAAMMLPSMDRVGPMPM
jgi:hypothetical protein